MNSGNDVGRDSVYQKSHTTRQKVVCTIPQVSWAFGRSWPTRGQVQRSVLQWDLRKHNSKGGPHDAGDEGWPAHLLQPLLHPSPGCDLESWLLCSAGGRGAARGLLATKGTAESLADLTSEPQTRSVLWPPGPLVPTKRMTSRKPERQVLKRLKMLP